MHYAFDDGVLTAAFALTDQLHGICEDDDVEQDLSGWGGGVGFRPRIQPPSIFFPASKPPPPPCVVEFDERLF